MRSWLVALPGGYLLFKNRILPGVVGLAGNYLGRANKTIINDNYIYIPIYKAFYTNGHKIIKKIIILDIKIQIKK